MINRSVACSALVLGLVLTFRVDAQISGFSARDQIRRENRLRADSIVASGVDTGTGAFLIESVLMNVEGARDISFVACYSSVDRGLPRVLGPGWTHNYEGSLSFGGNTIFNVHWTANQRNVFELMGSGEVLPIDLANRYDKFVRQSNGNNLVTAFDGTAYEFNRTGQLRSITNKIGQQIQTVRDGGRRVTALFEPESRRRIFLKYSPLVEIDQLQHIEDAQNRLIFFDYYRDGRLAQIYDPATTGSTQGDNFNAIPIPDNNPAGVTHTITVGDDEPIGLVEFQSAMMNHSRPNDLRLRLTSPTGTTVEITPGPVGDGVWNLSELVLDNFNGENPQGDWRVNVRDVAAGQTGFLNTFRLLFSEPTVANSFEYNQAGQVTRVLGPDGEQMLANQYDAQGRIIAQDDGVTTNLPARFEYQDRPDGGLTTRYFDRTGAMTTYVHDANYNLVSVTDPLENTVVYEYDANGNRTLETDALGRVTQFIYDVNGNLERVVEPDQALWIYRHNGLNNLIQVVDPDGNATQLSYDGSNNLRRITDAMGHQDVKDYGGFSQMTSSSLSDGASMSFEYDQGQRTLATHPDGGRDGGSRSTYDRIGRPVRIVDGDGHRIRMVYNSRGDVVEKIDQLDRVERREYDRRGRLLALTDTGGGVTRYAYDGNDNVTSITDAMGRVTRYSYDGEGRLINTVDPSGAETTYTYDPLGRQLTETNPNGQTIRREYDAVGNVVAQYDADDVLVERMTYNVRDLPIRVVDADGSTLELEYDVRERLTKMTDSLGRETTFEYDALDRVIAVTDPLGRTATRTYQADDVIDRFEDARGAVVNFGYDNTNRIRRVSFPWGGSALIEHNNRDLETRVSYPSGRQLEFGYNSAGLLSALFRFELNGPREPNTFFTYDDRDNLITVETRAGGQRRTDSESTFDDVNRITSHTNARGETVGYAYDAAGNMTELTYPDGKRVRYEYDDARRLTRVVDWANRETRYSYDANSQLTRVELPNGTERLIEYDEAGQIIGRREIGPTGTIVDFDYSYDAGGRLRIASSGVQRPPFLAQPVTMTYSPFADHIETYNGERVAYDEDGNLTRGPLGDGMANFTYDVSGNLVAAGGVSYLYDASDRLMGFRDSSGETRLTTNEAANFPQTLVATSPSGQVTYYVWGLGLAYEVTGGQIRVHHFDQTGSTIAFSNSAGGVTGTVSYGPYGELGPTTGDAESLFLYHSLFGVITGPNGLNYMRFRWYAPQIKRFLTPDGVYGDIEDLSTLNLYEFVGSNPVSISDPNGEFWNLIIGAIFGLVSQAISDAILGREPRWEEYLFAGLAGAVGGAAVGRLSSVAGKVAGGAVFGFAEGAAGEAFAQKIRPELEEDPGQALISGLIGAGVGAASGLLKGAVKLARARRIANKAFANKAIQKTANFALRRRGKTRLLGLQTRFNPKPKVSVIPRNNKGFVPKPTTKPGGVKFSGLSSSQALKLNAFVASKGFKGGFSGLTTRLKKVVKESDKIALAGPQGITPRPPRVAVRIQGRQAVNTGLKNAAGEHRHISLYQGALFRAGKPLPNAPLRTSAAY